jgi:hypothetical protein
VDDSRRGLRRRVFKDWVVQAKGLGTACTQSVQRWRSFECRNSRNTGAPDAGGRFRKARQKMQVIWRDGKKMGVAFI